MLSVEKIAVGVLTRYLGEYVEGINEKNLQISLMKGSVNLSNLQLKKESLDSLELPVTVKKGFLGGLELSIPWQNLKFEQASLKIQTLYLEAGPKEERDHVSSFERVQATKKRVLQIAELMASDDNSQTSDSSNSSMANNINTNNGGYFESIITNVVNNLQVFIDDVHIRYVDCKNGFDFGIRFKSLHAQSTDCFWKPKVITQNDVKDKLFYKYVQLSQFSVYWNTSVFNKINNHGYQHILSPVDVNVHLIINKNDISESTLPKVSVECTIPSININFCEHQYRELLLITEIFSNYRRSMKYLHLRPSNGNPSNNTLEWWKYAINGVSHNLRLKKQRCSWKYIAQLLKDKKRYILLYAKKKILEEEKLTLSDDELQELKSIEYQYEVEVLLNFRSLSKLYIPKLKEDRKAKKDELIKKKNWFGKMFNQSIPFDISTISIKELKELEKAHQVKAQSQKSILPKDYVQHKIEFTLERSEILLQDFDLHKIMSFNCTYLSVDCLLRNGGAKFCSTVNSFYIDDHYSLNTIFPKLLYSKSVDRNNTPIVQFTLDYNPIGKEDEIYFDIEVTLSSINLVLPRNVIMRSFDFFAAPIFERKSRSLEQLAIEKLQELKDEASRHIKYMFRNNKKEISVNLSIPSPKLIIPVSLDDLNSPVLILDLGFISFQNQEIDHHSNDDSNYREYILQLSKTNAYISNIREFIDTNIKNLPPTNQSHKLIENFDLESKISICKFQSPDFPLFRVMATLNTFYATITESSTTSLLKVLGTIFSSQSDIHHPKSNFPELKMLSDIPKIKTHQFDVRFNIGEFELKLHDDLLNEVARLNLTNLVACISQTSHCTSFEGTLSSAFIECQTDSNKRIFLFTSEIEKSGSSENMISTLNQLKGNESCLILVKYMGIPENSPLFNESRHSIFIEFNSIHAFACLISINKIASYFDRILSRYIEENGASDDVNNASTKSVEVSKVSPIEKKTEHIMLNLNVVVNSVGFTIPIEHNPLIEGYLGKSEISFTAFSSGNYKSTGQIGKVTIDYEEATKVGFPHILEIESDKLFKFEVYRNNQKKIENEDKKLISLNYLVEFDVGALKFHYFHSFFVILSEYLKNFRKNQNSKKKQSIESPSKKSVIRYQINVQSPNIILPAVCNEFVEGICLNLGSIAIKNTLFNDPFPDDHNEFVLKEKIYLKIENLFVESFNLPAINDNYLQYLVENTNIDIVVEKNYFEEGLKDKVWNISSSIPSFSANISRYHVSVISNILTKNFHYKRAPSNPCIESIADQPPDSSDNSRIIAFSCKVLQSCISLYNGDGIVGDHIFSDSHRNAKDLLMVGKESPLVMVHCSRVLFSCIFQKNITSLEIATTHFTLDDIRPSKYQFYPKMCTPIIKKHYDNFPIDTSFEDIKSHQFFMKIVSGKELPTTFEFIITNNFVIVMEAWLDLVALYLQIIPDIKSILSNISSLFSKKKEDNSSNPTPLQIKLKLPNPEIQIIKNETSINSECFIFKGSSYLEFVSDPAIKSQQLKMLLDDVEFYKSCSQNRKRTFFDKSSFELSYHEIDQNCLIYSILIKSSIKIQFALRDYINIKNLLKHWSPLFSHLKSVSLSTKQGAPPALPKDVTDMTQRFEFASSGGSLLIINDLDTTQHEQRLLYFVLESFRTSLYNWSSFEGKKMELFLSSTLRIDFLNQSVDEWEAMLEQTKIELEVSPNSKTLKNVLTKIENININISCAFMDALLNTFHAVNAFKLQNSIDSENSQIVQKTSVYSYFIKNETGLELVYGLTDNDDNPPISTNYLSPNQLNPILDESLGNEILKIGEEDPQTLESSYVDCIAVDKLGKYKSKIRSNESFFVASCEITPFKGSKLVTIRPNRIFINSTQHPIIICIKLENSYTQFTILPSKKLYVPIKYLKKETYFCVTPNFETHKVTKAINFLNNKELYYLTTPPKLKTFRQQYFIMKYSRDHSDHTFDIFPSLMLYNALPISLSISFIDPMISTYKIPSNGYTVNPDSLLDLQEIAINEDRDIQFIILHPTFGKPMQYLSIPVSFSPRFSQQSIQYQDEIGSIFTIRVSYTTTHHIRKITLYSEYIIVNNTSLNIFYLQPGSVELIAGQIKNKKFSSSKSLLFSPNSKLSVFQPAKLVMKVNQSNLSEPLSIEREGVNSSVIIEDPANQFQYSLIASIKIYDKFWKTKEVSIYPKYIIINQTNEVLWFSQDPLSDKQYSLNSHSFTPFYWISALPKELYVRFQDDQEWSQPFQFLLNNFSLKIRNKKDPNTYSTYYITISLDSKEISTLIKVSYQILPDYEIENQTKYNLFFRQKNSQFLETVKPNETLPFSLDYIHSNHELWVTVENSSNVLEIPFDEYSFDDKEFIIGNSENEILYWSLISSNEGKSKLFIFKSSPSTLLESTRKSILTFHVENISISLIDEKPQEIALFTLQKIKLKSELTEENINMHLSIHNFQLDNQLLVSPFPVLIKPINTITDNENFFLINASIRIGIKSMLYCNSLQIQSKPIDFKMDEEFIVRFMEFSKAITLYLKQRNKNELMSLTDEYDLISKGNQAQSSSIILYFDTFDISTIELNASFKVDAASADEEFNRLLPSYLRLLLNFEGTSLTFDELKTFRIKCLPSELLKKLSSYYSISTKNKLYALLSSDLIGNPKSLVSNIGTGVYDFFNEPTEAIVNSPANIGAGFAKGTKSLVMNSLYALSNTTSKLSDSLASGVATVSFDSDFQRERDWNNARDRPQHVVEGAALGIMSLGKGLFQGITGVITEPIKGSQEGTSGVIKGLVKGTTGLIVKPTVGVLDSVSKISEGVKNTTSSENLSQRIRLPRYIGRDKVVKPFDEELAKYQYLLQTVQGRRFANDTLQAHYVINNGDIFMISQSYLLIINDSREIIWEVAIILVRAISCDKEVVKVSYYDTDLEKHRTIKFTIANTREEQNISEKLVKLISTLKLNLI